MTELLETPGTGETHFVQRGDGPVFVGPGSETLACRCGNALIQGYDAVRFLSVGIQCGRCGQLTTTPALPGGAWPPFAVVVAEPVAELRPSTTVLPRSAVIIGRAEMDRITALYQPVTPAENVYRISPALLDEVIALHDRHATEPLRLGPADPENIYLGLRDHPLSWAIAHLRSRMRREKWDCLEGIATPTAVVHVTGFLHFIATWSHHPLFPAMMASAALRGFSVHGLVPFATAHCVTMQGNRVSFPAPTSFPARIASFNLATGPTDLVGVHIVVFDRFEVPFGQAWDQTNLRAAVGEQIAAAQGRINLRNPGLLVLSPGAALAGFDEALIVAVKHALQSEGRKNRGLMAVAPTVLRLLGGPEPHSVRFGYGFFPIANRHYAGDSLLQMGS